MHNYSKHRILLLTTAIIFFLAGCQSNEKPKNDSRPKEEKTVETTAKGSKSSLPNTAQPLPESLDQIVDYPKGEYASRDSQLSIQVKEHLKDVKKVSKDAGEEELAKLFTYLYSLFKMDYEDPVKIMEAITGEAQTESGQPKDEGNYSVEIVLDASGSMANKVGSKNRMDLAKEAISHFASKLPKEARVGLRVYGHKGTGSQADKKLSCASNELVYPIQTYNQQNLQSSLKQFKPAGWTPLAKGIEEAQKDLQAYKGEKNKNVIYVVSDGIETCGGDPVQAAKNLKDSGIEPVVHIIGFDVGGKDEQQLKAVAEAAGGTYTNAKNYQQLQQEFDKTVGDAAKWIEWYYKEFNKLITNKHDQEEEIFKYLYSWKDQFVFESVKIQFALDELNSNNAITRDQKDLLMKKRNEFYDQADKKVYEMYNKLLDTNYQDFETRKNEIYKVYEENVSK